jgi:hypothetical protein
MFRVGLPRRLVRHSTTLPAQPAKLEEAGLVGIEKRFVRKKPKSLSESRSDSR